MARIKILVVDDEKDTLRFIEKNINRIVDCDLDTVINGDDAIEKIETDKFDLVILDLKMPGITGLDVIKRVKESKNFPKILVMTAYDSQQIADEVIEEGAVDYMPKPLQLDILKRKVETILKD